MEKGIILIIREMAPRINIRDKEERDKALGQLSLSFDRLRSWLRIKGPPILRIRKSQTRRRSRGWSNILDC